MKRFGEGLLMMAALVLLLALVLAAFQLPVMDSLRLIAEGAFGDKFGVARTLVKATPLLLCGLGVVVAWRSGMFNIGGEGQLLAGALAGAAAAKWMLAASGPVVWLAGLMLAAVGGAAYGGLAGWLGVRRGVNVVIGTILLNFVAIQLVNWAVAGPLQEAKRQVPLTDRLPTESMLPKFDPQSDLHLGVVLAVLLTGFLAIFLARTAAGFRLRLVGENASAARAARIKPEPIQLRAMLLSGGLCGLGGGIELFGVTGQLGSGFSLGWGFLAIPVALVGGLNPWGTALSALFFGAVLAGSESLARFSTSGSAIVLVIQAMAVFGLIGMRSLRQRRLAVEAGT